MTTSTRRTKRTLGTIAIATMALAGTAACSSGDSSGGSSGSGAAKANGSKKIALLLPESKTTRYEAFDKPLFTAAVKAACSDCDVIYSNAGQNADTQKQQAEAAITQKVGAIVLDSVDTQSAASIVNEAKAAGIPVISYDRFVAGADYYVSFDNEKVGELQGQALVDAMKKAGHTSGNIVMVNGSPTDSNAPMFKKGAHTVLDKSGYKVVAETDVQDWAPENAQSWMEGQVTKVKNGLAGVYVANDGMAGGVISALKGGGVNPLPPVGGQDAEIAGLQRILAGDQAFTVYKAIKPEAEDAAKAAVALVGGQKPQGKTTFEGTSSTLLTPVVVTKSNITSTVIKDGFYKASQICTGQFAAACKSAGIN